MCVNVMETRVQKEVRDLSRVLAHYADNYLIDVRPCCTVDRGRCEGQHSLPGKSSRPLCAGILFNSSSRFVSVMTGHSGNEVPHIFTRKSRVQPKEILITSAKRLLQQNRQSA